MIYLGRTTVEQVVLDYLAENPNINKIFLCGDELKLDTPFPVDFITYADSIMYVHYYRWLQSVDNASLIVLNNCFTSANRYLLNYNCMRKYVLQTPHRLIFKYYPIQHDEADFMTLWDMTQNNPFLKEPYSGMTEFPGVVLNPIQFDIEKVDVLLSEMEMELYYNEKEKIISSVNKDPDVIPRRLLKFSEKLNAKHVKNTDRKDVIKPVMRIAVNQSGVDKYYYNKLLEFKEKLENVCQKIRNTKRA